MNQQTCNPEMLDAFLQNELSEIAEQQFTRHLDECSDCREELESRAAEQSAWQEASSLLGGAAQRSTSAIADHRTGTVRSPQIEQVLHQLAPTDDPAMLGRIGSYEVSGVVGAGGMGVVLKAHDRSLDRIVAIKVMSPHLASSGSARKRFAREAKAAAAVLHPNVIAIHGVASDDACPYLVMPYVRGASLQKRIESQGSLPLKDTLRIGSQIAAGLAAAHEQGLVHRDIKPANILLEEGVERVTITDFGLARAVDDASMTCSGVIAGTPQYMSPEQTRGEPIDARSDLFSLGSVLYAMCTGRSPFRAETTYGVLHRIANDNATPVCEVNSDIPVWLGHIIERLMAKRPDDRFESAAQVAELLEGCLAHVQQPSAMPLPDSVAALAPRKIRRPPIGRYIAAAAGAFALFFAGILIVLELDKGTLTIESELDDVPIRIVQGDKVVDRLTVTTSGNSVRVAAGTYVVELETKRDGMVVENDQVSLKRGATEHVMIRLSTNANAATGVSKQSAMEGTDSGATFSAPDAKAKIVVDLYGGKDVLGQMNTRGKNKARHVKLLQDLNAIDGVQVNFREAGQGNEIPVAIVRDPAGLLNQETLTTGKPSARRDTISKALAQIPNVRWEEGPSIEAEKAVAPQTEIVPAIVDPERATNAEQRVGKYLSAIQENDVKKSKSSSKVPKESNPLEARTLDDVTSVYNEQTRQLRTELFNPPIPDLTTDQMRAAMLDVAGRYRKQGKIEIASALENSVVSSRLDDRLTFMGSLGTAPASFRQITPQFHFRIATNATWGVGFPLRKAELRYSHNGWSSKAWGDIHPPITGNWELVSVEERGESLTEDAFNDWRKKHASWTELTIDENSLTMAGDDSTKFDFEIDHDAGVSPQYTISQDGETKFAGIFYVASTFVDDTRVTFAVDLEGRSKPRTFPTSDGKTTNLTYRRVGETEIQENAP